VLSLFKGQVDEHASDLGCERRSFELGHEIKNCVSNRLLEMRVICLNRRNNFQGVVIEGLDSRVLATSESHFLHLLRHTVQSRRQRNLGLVHLLAVEIHIHLIVGRSVAAACILNTHHVPVVTHMGWSLQVRSGSSLLVVSLALIVLALELTRELALG
jgi:hypothetical protein